MNFGIEAYQISYTSRSCDTVDESLVLFRGRCSSKVDISLKSIEYRIKIRCKIHATNAYVLNALIYSEKSPGGPERQQASMVVWDLTTTIANSGRNATSDNVFIDFSLAV